MTARLEMHDVHKRFGPTHALRGVSLCIEAGEVHALVGENGAGKSTLMKILSGALHPDQGHMTLAGRAYAPRDPRDARRHGVVMIYQELTLAPHLDVQANMLLGQEPTRWGFLCREEGRRRVAEALQTLHHAEIRPETPVRNLSPAGQQLVEIARALLTEVRVLVLDEPTSSLTQQDAQHLFGLIRRLRDRGVSVVYISHFLEEVQQIADRFTVLRDGENVITSPVQGISVGTIIEHMVGRKLDELFPRVPRTPGKVILELKDLRLKRDSPAVNLCLRRGEVLGLAGIVGAGRTELLRAIYGLDRVKSGQLRVQDFTGWAKPGQRIRQGLGMLSEDRKTEGLALDQSLADNLTYSRTEPYSRLGWLNLQRRRQAVRDWLDRLGVRRRSENQAVGELSGGNQQKVAIGRLLHQQADVLLLDEPTRGVDVGSKAEIYRLISERAARGAAVLLVSSYLPELFGLCDRLAVMSRAGLSEARPVAEWTPEQALTLAIGVEER